MNAYLLYGLYGVFVGAAGLGLLRIKDWLLEPYPPIDERTDRQQMEWEFLLSLWMVFAAYVFYLLILKFGYALLGV